MSFEKKLSEAFGLTEAIKGHDEEYEEYSEKLDEAGKGKANPWAICHAELGPKKTKKFERCVKSVKKKTGYTEGQGGVADEPAGEGDVEKDIKPQSMFSRRLDTALDEDDRPEEEQTIVPGSARAAEVEKKVKEMMAKKKAKFPKPHPSAVKTLVPGSEEAIATEKQLRGKL